MTPGRTTESPELVARIHGNKCSQGGRTEGESRKLVGWITIRVVLFGGALATLCGSGLLDPSIFSPI